MKMTLTFVMSIAVCCGAFTISIDAAAENERQRFQRSGTIDLEGEANAGKPSSGMAGRRAR